jgi:predicted DNA repair protein MutK
MAASSLLALIDDIATLLDDVAMMTKVATRKTVGLLSDDLALNAEQVSGVKADRELPVVWAVAKGSFVNKLILVPLALLVSALAPWLITPVLMVGGAYLCYEGFEKIAHKFLTPASEGQQHHAELLKAVADPEVDILAFEKRKVRGAIRTDFILSAEIIVIALSSVADADFLTRALSVSLIAMMMTVGVYGFVAAIVKMDDAGLYLMQNPAESLAGSFKRWFGKRLLLTAPLLMKTLSVVGTAAMFLVGGGIITHGIPAAHVWLHHGLELLDGLRFGSSFIQALGPTLFDGLVGLFVGGLLVACHVLGTKVFTKH